MAERSELQKALDRSSRCPRCRKFLLFTRTYEFGKKKRTVTYPKDPATVAECPRCNGSWFFFERPVTIDVVEGSRKMEVAFTETLTLDNSKGLTPLKRTRSISREWTKSLSLENERSATTQNTFGLETQGVSISSMAEQAIRSKYSLSKEQTQTYTDELEFEVPPGTLRRVTLTFNYNWQHGTLLLTQPDGEPVEIPYKIASDLSLDVAQEDEQAADRVG